MKVGVFHPGVQHSRQTALALQDLDKLAFLATGLFDHPHSPARRVLSALPAKLRDRADRELSRFASNRLDPALVRAFPRYELPERLASRLGATALAQSLDARLNEAFGRKIAAIAQDEQVALWGYDGSSWSAFTDARTAQCPKILDRTMADCRSWNAQRARLIEQEPDWFADGSPAWSAERIAHDDLEYAAADRIVCGSPFVAETIAGNSQVDGLQEKLTVLPYSYAVELFGAHPPADAPGPHDPVRFLFVGQVAGRKGIRHVLDAFMLTARSEASLTVVGPVVVDDGLLAPYRDRVTFTGPVPRAQVPAIMAQHHAFVFPSYNEGSAVVLLEAMASGLAIIQTKAAGLGASAQSGVVLDRPDTQAVASAMRALIDDKETLQEMRRAAKTEAARCDFAAYRATIEQVLQDMGI